MKTLTEDYVSYETAVLLKEKGFVIKPYHQYYVSSCGKVFGCKGNEMKQSTTNRGYKRITLSINGKEERWSVHRLVALLFVPNPEQKLQVNHIDGNKENNDASNLEWCTASENNKHAIQTGLRKNPTKGKFGKEHIASRPFVCVETGKIYYCQRELAEELGEDMKGVSHITRACKYGLLDHGFHWRYFEPNELVKLLFEKGYTKYPVSYDGDEWFCYCQMALKWLRELGIVITIKTHYPSNPELCKIPYSFLIEDYRPSRNMEKEHGKYSTGYSSCANIDDFLTENKLLFDGFNFGEFEKYEQAVEAALKYTLENLI